MYLFSEIECLQLEIPSREKRYLVLSDIDDFLVDEEYDALYRVVVVVIYS